MKHLPTGYVFGLKFSPDEYTVGDLLGCSTSKLHHQYRGYKPNPPLKISGTPRVKAKPPVAEQVPINRPSVVSNQNQLQNPPPIKSDELIIPDSSAELQMLEVKHERFSLNKLHKDKEVTPKITANMNAYAKIREDQRFGPKHVYGVPTIREHFSGFKKKLSDDNVNFKLSLAIVISLLSPSPLNVYGDKVLLEFAQKSNQPTILKMKENLNTPQNRVTKLLAKGWPSDFSVPIRRAKKAVYPSSMYSRKNLPGLPEKRVVLAE
ncbi:hypothetical protein HK096_003013 [Nowakowskiella sp. JEL0078]|nr:hypothetical protein HK096_003013 [Nowakowskiella sp. JEL0078]